MIRALTLALVLLLGCAREPYVTYATLTSVYGVTICYQDRGYSFIASDLTPIREADTKAHEAKHVEQYARYPSCAAFDAVYATPRGRLESEAEAYHAGWCVSVAMGEDSVARRSSAVERLNRVLGGEINRLTIVQTFLSHDPCP